MRKLYLLFYLIFVGAAVTLISCEDDEDPEYLVLTGLEVDGVDLITSSESEFVPVEPVLEAEFSHPLNATTVDNSSVILTRIYDGVVVPLTLSANGTSLTITPETELSKGTRYSLKFENDILSSGGLTMTTTTRIFTTDGSFVTEGIVSYYAFEGNGNDSLGNHHASASNIQDITFVESKSNRAGRAAHFNGTSSIIEIPGADDFMAQDDLTVSFWVKADSDQDGHYVLGLGGSHGFYFEIAEDWESVAMVTRYQLSNGNTLAVENRFTGTGQLNEGETVNKNVVVSGGVGNTFFDNLWAHILYSYSADSMQSSIYINGELVKQQDFNLYPDGSPEKLITGVTYDGNAAPGNELALGYLQARENGIEGEPSFSDPEKHFKGLLDDVKIFSSILTNAEIRRLYNSEVPN